jgi:hypothetical protein
MTGRVYQSAIRLGQDLALSTRRRIMTLPWSPVCLESLRSEARLHEEESERPRRVSRAEQQH